MMVIKRARAAVFASGLGVLVLVGCGADAGQGKDESPQSTTEDVWAYGCRTYLEKDLNVYPVGCRAGGNVYNNICYYKTICYEGGREVSNFDWTACKQSC
jgi:hypothetical protein